MSYRCRCCYIFQRSLNKCHHIRHFFEYVIPDTKILPAVIIHFHHSSLEVFVRISKLLFVCCFSLRFFLSRRNTRVKQNNAPRETRLCAISPKTPLFFLFFLARASSSRTRIEIQNLNFSRRPFFYSSGMYECRVMVVAM